MTTIESSSEVFTDTISHNPETQKHVLNEYLYPRNRVRVEVVGANDSRIDAAHEIEVAAMVELGDPEEEVRAEFAPYRDSSIYFLAFPIDSDGHVEDIQGMGRIIPSSERNGNKSLADLASIGGWSTPGISEYLDPITGESTHNTDDVIEAFKLESGCTSLDKVWDIATVGFNIELGALARAKLGDSIISAFAEEGICEWKRGRLTHCVSFNQVDAHRYFNNLGYPFTKMFGLDPMVYDSFGTSLGMEAQPAWFSMEELVKKIENKPKGHLGRLALGQCAPDSITDRAL